MKPNQFHTSTPLRCQGLSLVELMVGMTVGLLTALIVTQVMSSFQSQNASTTNAAHAQENGMVAMQMLSDDLQSAGYGYGTQTYNPYACTTLFTRDKDAGGNGNIAGLPLDSTDTTLSQFSGLVAENLPLFPVSIQAAPSSGGTGIFDANSDILSIRQAARVTGTATTSLSSAIAWPPTSNLVPVNIAAYGFSANDLALVSNGSACSLFQVASFATGNNSGVPYGIVTTTGSSLDTPSAGPSGGYASGATVFNVGDTGHGAIVTHQYSIAAVNSGNTNGGSMQMAGMSLHGVMTLDSSGTLQPLAMADGIVALKAQYGIASAPNSPTIPTGNWVGTDSSNWSKWAPDKLVFDATATSCAPGMSAGNAACIKAVRIVVVARVGKKESAPVSCGCQSTPSSPGSDGSCTGTISGRTNGPCPWVNPTTDDPVINLLTVPNWNYYRYKVYTIIIPLRNVLYSSPPAS